MEKAKQLKQHARDFIMNKKKEWTKVIHEKTVKRLLLDSFPDDLG